MMRVKWMVLQDEAYGYAENGKDFASGITGNRPEHPGEPASHSAPPLAKAGAGECYHPLSFNNV